MCCSLLTRALSVYPYHLPTPSLSPPLIATSPRGRQGGKSLNANMAYLPFGGGATYCPGRRFARNEVIHFNRTPLRIHCDDMAVP